MRSRDHRDKALLELVVQFGTGGLDALVATSVVGSARPVGSDRSVIRAARPRRSVVSGFPGVPAVAGLTKPPASGGLHPTPFLAQPGTLVGAHPPGSTSELPGDVKVRVNRAGFIDRTDTDVRAPRSRTSVPKWTRSSWPPRPPRVQRAAGLRLPSHALGSASALAGRLVGAAVNLSGELRMCHDGHHRDNEQPVLSSEGCEAGTFHTGVSFPTSSLCF